MPPCSYAVDDTLVVAVGIYTKAVVGALRNEVSNESAATGPSLVLLRRENRYIPQLMGMCRRSRKVTPDSVAASLNH